MKLQIAIFIAVVSSGCVINEKYPDDWAALKQPAESRTDSCPDISGIYRDRSVMDDTPIFHPTMTSLTDALHSTLEKYSTGTSITVEISQPSEGIILVKPSEGEEFRISINEGHFSCRDGVIDLGSHGEFGGGGIALAGGTSGYSLFDSEDQSLVLQERVFMAGVFTIIPFVASTKDWVARWVQVDASWVGFTPYSQLVQVDENKQIENIIDLSNEEILFVHQASLGYSISDVTLTCYADELVLTDQKIYGVWTKFPARDSCRPPDKGDYNAWDYSDVVSLEPGALPRSIKLDLRCNATPEDETHECASDTLVIRSMDEIDMMKIEGIIRERITPE